MSRQQGILETLVSLDHYEFEYFVADVWEERQGWDTKVLQQSRDDGIDVVGQPPGGGDKTIIQAKQYAPDRTVSVTEVREVNGAVNAYTDVSSATFVTTGKFTSPALDYADRSGTKCIDGQALVKIVRKYDALPILEWYEAGRPEDWKP